MQECVVWEPPNLWCSVLTDRTETSGKTSFQQSWLIIHLQNSLTSMQDVHFLLQMRKGIWRRRREMYSRPQRPQHPKALPISCWDNSPTELSLVNEPIREKGQLSENWAKESFSLKGSKLLTGMEEAQEWGCLSQPDTTGQS